MTWELLWKICLIGSLTLFAGMSIWVSIGGAFEVRQLLRRLEHLDELEQSDDDG